MCICHILTAESPSKCQTNFTQTSEMWESKCRLGSLYFLLNFPKRFLGHQKLIHTVQIKIKQQNPTILHHHFVKWLAVFKVKYWSRWRFNCSLAPHPLPVEQGDHFLNQRDCWETCHFYFCVCVFFLQLLVYICLFLLYPEALCASEKRPTLRACLFYNLECCRQVELSFPQL